METAQSWYDGTFVIHADTFTFRDEDAEISRRSFPGRPLAETSGTIITRYELSHNFQGIASLCPVGSIEETRVSFLAHPRPIGRSFLVQMSNIASLSFGFPRNLQNFLINRFPRGSWYSVTAGFATWNGWTVGKYETVWLQILLGGEIDAAEKFAAFFFLIFYSSSLPPN